MVSYTTCKNVRYSKRVFFKKVKEWIFEKIPLEGAEFTKGHSWWRKQLLKSSVIAAMRCLQRAAPLILSDIRLLQSVLRGTWGCNRALQSIKASFWCLASLWHFRQKLWFPQKAVFLFESALGWVRRAAGDEKGGIPGTLPGKRWVPGATDLSRKSGRPFRHWKCQKRASARAPAGRKISAVRCAAEDEFFDLWGLEIAPISQNRKFRLRAESFRFELFWSGRHCLTKKF